MKRFLLTVSLLGAAVPAFGAGFAQVGTFSFQWEGMFTGTRATALGQADVAGATGPGATLLNAAPLIAGDGLEAEYGNSDFHLDADMNVWGGTAEWSGWRLGYVRNEYKLDSLLVRTAYNPEGTGETFDAHDSMDVISLGYDLGRLVDDSGAWQWTLGAAYRGYQSSWPNVDLKETTWDVGTTVGWTTQHPYGWARASAGVTWQNIFNESWTYNRGEAPLPHSVGTGVTLESSIGTMDWGTEALKILMAYSHRFNPDSWVGTDTDHFGFEVTGAGFLVGRVGSNGRYPDGLNSWGLGLVFDQDFLGPVSVTADYGQYDMGWYEYEMWSVRARYSF